MIPKIKKIVGIKRKPSWLHQDFNITFVVPTDKVGVWTEVYEAASCRTWLCNYLYAVKSKTPFVSVYPRLPETKLEKDNTYLFVKAKTVVDMEVIKEKLKLLHKWEKKAKIPLTEVKYFPSKSYPGVLFIGDKCWQSTLWKNTIYSYLVKKVKRGRKEVFGNTESGFIHNSTGFYAICTGLNKPMYKVLFGKEWKNKKEEDTEYDDEIDWDEDNDGEYDNEED